MKILIATPCMDTMHLQYVKSLLGLKKPAGTAVEFWENSLVYAARDSLCGVFLASDADALLFIDSDMMFEADALERLIADEKDIVSGLCFRRRPPYTPAMWQTIRIGEGEDHEEKEYESYPRDALFPVDACGMAFCLVQRTVVEKTAERFHTCFQPYRCYGEDISFCIRARQLGFQAWVDSRVKIGHMAQTIVTETVFDSIRKAGGK